MEPLRPRGRAALAACARLPDRSPPAPPPPRGGSLGRPRPPRTPGRPRLLRARAGALARARRRRRRRRGLRPRGLPALHPKPLRPPPGRRRWRPSSCSASCASSAEAPGAPPPRRRWSWPSPSRPPASRSWPRRSSSGSCSARAGGRLAKRAAGGAWRWGWAWAWRSRRRPAARSSQLAGSARGQGFPTDVVLAHSVHPFTLVQTLVGGLYGNLSNLAGEWWGQNFFPRGFPYVLAFTSGRPPWRWPWSAPVRATRWPAASSCSWRSALSCRSGAGQGSSRSWTRCPRCGSSGFR